jgi:TolB-like protein/cytochrome c-type biogenesis protein CcmH/NrfG
LGNSFHSSRLYGFFCELRRRKVWRVAAGYGVVGWLIIQFATTVFPALTFPLWTARLVIVLVLAGFPIALILAWAFDVSSAGIEATPEIVPGDCPPTFSGRRKNLVPLAIAGLVIALVAGYFLIPRASARKLDKSIAVLPFDNFSADQENAFFADGIQDDILTNLARIGDLRVISRTSVMPYRGQTHNVREIGKALNVATILEGSVRREGQRVRINVQLIDASTDKHLWAQVYDRELNDVFAIQSELAQKIASALRATLSPDEQDRLKKKPTENSEAYLRYLEAHDISTRTDRSSDVLKHAEELYEQATQLDPSFALAFAQLSQLQSWIYYSLDPTPARLAKARAAAGEAMRLQPNLAESHLALGYTYYYGERDYDRALAEFEIARRDLPNDAGIFRAISAIERRQGKWKQSIEHREKAASLSPTDPVLWENLGTTHAALRDFPAAVKAFDRAVSLAPNSTQIKVLRARLEIEAKGDLRPMQQLLASLPENVDPNGTITLARYNLKMYERKFDELIGILERSPAEKSRGDTSAPISRSFLMATVYAQKKEKAKARASYEEARAKAENAVAESPDDGPRHALLGLIYAGLGRCEEAITEGKRAVELLPESRDAFDGPILAVSRARITMMCGDFETALALLDRSLQTPSGVTVQELRLDPIWDPLRADPRFQRMLTKFERKP